MTTRQAIRKALDELGAEAHTGDLLLRAAEILERPLAKDDFFRELYPALCESETSIQGSGSGGPQEVQ